MSFAETRMCRSTGLGEEDFAELPEDLIRKYTERFWVPEAFISMFGQMSIIRMDDGTKPE